MKLEITYRDIKFSLSGRNWGKLDIAKCDIKMGWAAFNAQYGNSLTVKTSTKFHDRFLIIDKAVLIPVGASLNYPSKRCFAFSSLDKSNIPDILARI